MKLATFTAGQAPELGLVLGDRIRPISRLLPTLGEDMRNLIARWAELESEVRRLGAEASLAASDLDLAQVCLLAPIRRPGKIMAIGLNYADHIAESKLGTPEHQIWFSKAPTATNAPFGDIEVPIVSQAVD